MIMSLPKAAQVEYCEYQCVLFNGGKMSNVLPQQRLLLELIIMSGDIAVPATNDGTMLYRTLKECENHGWLTCSSFGAGFDKATVTDAGRAVAVPAK